MKNILKFSFFVLCLMAAFFLENSTLLFLLFVMTFIWGRILKISLRSFWKSMKFLLPFVLFTAGMNSILNNLKAGIWMTIRLLLAYFMTYNFSKSITSLEFAKLIQDLLKPLKIIGIDNENIGMMANISFCVLPILKSEIEQKMYALKAKGFNRKLSNIWVILSPVLISILRRANEMEKSLKGKAYEE